MAYTYTFGIFGRIMNKYEFDMITSFVIVGIVIISLAFFWFLNEGRKIEFEKLKLEQSHE